MSWNYRIVQEQGVFTLRECYYDDTQGIMWGYSDAPQAPMGENPEELKENLHMMLLAFRLPILTAEALRQCGEVGP